MVIQTNRTISSTKKEQFSFPNILTIRPKHLTREENVSKNWKAHSLGQANTVQKPLICPQLENILFPIYRTPRLELLGTQFARHLLTDAKVNKIIFSPRSWKLHFAERIRLLRESPILLARPFVLERR
jgi:hypothetical protein